jgi:hypothetical protein
MNMEWMMAIIIMVFALIVSIPLITQQGQQVGVHTSKQAGDYAQLKQLCNQWEAYYQNCADTDSSCHTCEECSNYFRSTVFGFYKIAVFAKTSGITDSEMCVGSCETAKKCANMGFQKIVGVPVDNYEDVEGLTLEEIDLYSSQQSAYITKNFEEVKRSGDVEEIMDSCQQVCKVILQKTRSCQESPSICATSSARLT